MEQLPENSSEQNSLSAAIPPTSLGVMLRGARERLGLSVADVAAQIKFAPRQIEALEADDFKRLPEAAFLRGFVRSYAKILHLDAQTLLAALPQPKAATAESMPATVEVPFPVGHTSQKQTLVLLGAALLLSVIVAGFAAWHFSTPLKQSKVAKIEPPVPLPAEEQTTSEPVELKSSSIEPAVPKVRSSAVQSSDREVKTKASDKEVKTKASDKEVKTKASKAASQVESTGTAASPGKLPKTAELRLVFGEESWTEIKDKNGKIISSQVNPRGSELRLEGKPPFTMLIGHAASASLYYQGKQVDLTPYINEYSEVAHLNLK